MSWESTANPLTVVIGASKSAESLRRRFVRTGIRHAGTAGHLRGLRRMLASEREDLVIVCISLDTNTLGRHEPTIRTLLADAPGLAGRVRCVGLLPACGLSSELASLGCDVYVSGAADAVLAIDAMRDAQPLGHRFSHVARVGPPTRPDPMGHRLGP